MDALESVWPRLTAGKLAALLDRHVAPGWRAVGPAVVTGPCPWGSPHRASCRMGAVDGPPPVSCVCARGRPTVLDVLVRATGYAAQGLLLEAAGLLPAWVRPIEPRRPTSTPPRKPPPFVLVRGRPTSSCAEVTK